MANFFQNRFVFDLIMCILFSCPWQIGSNLFSQLRSSPNVYDFLKLDSTFNEGLLHEMKYKKIECINMKYSENEPGDTAFTTIIYLDSLGRRTTSITRKKTSKNSWQTDSTYFMYNADTVKYFQLTYASSGLEFYGYPIKIIGKGIRVLDKYELWESQKVRLSDLCILALTRDSTLFKSSRFSETYTYKYDVVDKKVRLYSRSEAKYNESDQIVQAVTEYFQRRYIEYHSYHALRHKKIFLTFSNINDKESILNTVRISFEGDTTFEVDRGSRITERVEHGVIDYYLDEHNIVQGFFISISPPRGCSFECLSDDMMCIHYLDEIRLPSKITVISSTSTEICYIRYLR